MPRKLLLAVLIALTSIPQAPARAEEPVDLSMMTRIRDEGFRRSQVMDTLFHLTDVIGPRLTGSPQLKEANDWTRQRFESWGLSNAHLEGYPFGRGWSFSACEVRMVSPRETPLIALPRAWTPATSGPVRGEVMKAKIESKEDLEKLKGKVAGKILLVDESQGVRGSRGPAVPALLAGAAPGAGRLRDPGRGRRLARGRHRALAPARGASTNSWRRRKPWRSSTRATVPTASCG